MICTTCILLSVNFRPSKSTSIQQHFSTTTTTRLRWCFIDLCLPRISYFEYPSTHSKLPQRELLCWVCPKYTFDRFSSWRFLNFNVAFHAAINAPHNSRRGIVNSLCFSAKQFHLNIIEYVEFERHLRKGKSCLII